MPYIVPQPHRSVAELVASAAALKQRHDWEALSALAAELPSQWGREWLRVADEVAFAESQLGRFAAARDRLARAHAIEPTHRRASALAYVHYAALLAHKIRKPRLDEPEPWRKGFERWIAEALRLKPDSLVDRYRLGIYHASIQTQKDVFALRAFRDVVRLFEQLPPATRGAGSRHWKTYLKALYGAARSAYRLGRFDEARRWIFRCIRLDGHFTPGSGSSAPALKGGGASRIHSLEVRSIAPQRPAEPALPGSSAPADSGAGHHVSPVFKLFLAAKVLVAQGQLEHAERALRLATEAPHDGDRDFVFALLAAIALRQDRVDDAADWITLNILPHHRKPYVWRLLGDCEAKRGQTERALKLYKSALLKDRGGRHRTLSQVGRLAEQAGDLAAARQAYEQAADFRRRRYLTEDPDALQALAQLCERQGDLDRARDAYTRMARLPLCAARAQRELARLAS